MQVLRMLQVHPRTGDAPHTMDATMTEADLTAHLQATLDAMPPVRAMQFRVERWTGDAPPAC